MLRELRASELGRWAAFYSIDPWGATRNEMGHAKVAHTVATAWLKKRDGSQFTLADFMIYLEREQDKQADLSKRLRAALKKR